MTDNVIRDGIANGYQTMDLLAAMFFSVIIITSIYEKGYKDKKTRMKLSMASSLVAGLLLFLVYGGLAYLGATTGTLWQKDLLAGNVNQASLLINITNGLLGKTGVIVLGIVVACACLTTAIGLTSSAAGYFNDLSKGKFKYEWVVIIVSVVSALICNLGLSEIINITAPILTVIYPLSVFLICTTFLHDKVKNLNAYRIASTVIFVISLFTVLYDTFGIPQFSWVHGYLPLDSYGFNWLLPGVIAFIIGMFIPGKKIDELEFYQKAKED